MRFRRYLPMLREHGIESSVFTGTPKEKKITRLHKKEPWYSVAHGERLPMEKHLDIEVMRYRLPERPAKKRLGMYHAKLRENLKLYYKDINVIQFLSPFSMEAIETFKYANKNNIATVVACTLAKKPHPNLIKRIIKNYQTKKIYSSADCVVVSSEEMRDYLYEYGVNNRIEVIGNGVDTNTYKPVRELKEKESIRRKLGIPIDKKVLLNVGTVHPRKGTDLLLKAFERIAQQRDDIQLYIAGSRVDMIDGSLREFHREIHDLATQAGLTDAIHFLGLVDNVNEYMKASDVFVFPSREEGMGNVVMEAMASGLPVVVTPYLGFPKVFGNNDHYILTEFCSEDIAEKILHLICHETLSDQITSNAYNNVIENLNLDNSVRMYSKLYKINS